MKNLSQNPTSGWHRLALFSAVVLLLLALASTCQTLSAATAGAPEEPNDLSFGKRHVLQSKVLGREQEILIYTPRGYEDSASHPLVPVLYFTDGDRQYLHLAGLTDFLGERGQQIPPMVLVGIVNGRAEDARRTELAPTFSTEQKTGGGSDKFYQFIRDEVIPYVEARHRAAPFRILAGQSLGGLFALHVLHEDPEAFGAIIASSPSLWWDDRALLKNSARWGRDGQFLFFTMEKPDRETPHPSAAREFSRILRDHAAPGLKWEFKGYPAEWHGSVYHRSFHDGLQFIFPDWSFQHAADLTGSVTYAQLVEHHAKLSQRYGYDVPVLLTTVQAVAAELLAQKRFPDAAAFCAAHVERFPDSSGAHAALANVHRRAGDLEAARTHYQKAIELDSKNASAKRALEELTSAQ